MANTNFGKTTTTDLTGSVPDFMQDSKTTDGVYTQKENKWTNPDAAKYYGFYYGVGEFRAAINAFATWTVGLGYDTEDARTKVTLDHVRGWGEDTFLSVLWNMIVVKKFNGDSYSEVIREKGDKAKITDIIINIKTLDPRRMAHISNKQGVLDHYEYTQSDGKIKILKPFQVLHFCNKRVLDEPHGTAETSAVEWVIEKIQQAREDYARLMHVSSVRIFYVDENDTTRQNIIKAQYAEGLKNKEVMLITCKPQDAQFQDLVVPPADAWIRWLTYLEDKFYKQLGVPKVVLGGTAENTEASAKVGVLVYEPVWMMEISEIEADIWNQLGLKIKIRRQPSLRDGLQQQEQKNQAQTGFQPNDTQVNIEGER